MNLEYLKEFVVLAETRNFWEASERLFINQSTLSKHIKVLEQYLEAPLFVRTTRRVELTSFGQLYLPYAKTIQRAEYEGLAAIRQMQNIQNGLLTIGTFPSMPQYHITEYLSAFQEQYPATNFQITEGDSFNLMNDLKKDHCELIFTRENNEFIRQYFPDISELIRIPCVKDRLVALLPQNHSLASSDSIHLQQLSTERFCFIKEGSLMYQICLEACQQAGFVPNISFTSHRLDSVVDMVSKQNCVALLMDHQIDYSGNDSKTPWVMVPVLPSIETQISLCYKASRTLSPAAQQFVDFFSQNRNALK